jgi:hypothetical protein
VLGSLRACAPRFTEKSLGGFMKDLREGFVRWLLAVGVASTLVGGVAYARQGECWTCRVCGCAPDGGYILCCDVEAC